MKGNPMCRLIPWNRVSDDSSSGAAATDTDENKKLQKSVKKEQYIAWCNGKTGYPFIDACMRQLNSEGWIHHLARHSVACFLTRGDLWISWEEGRNYFDRVLLDGDYALNNSNWMWLSASAYFHQFFRVYSPIAFGKKTDKNGDYIRKYCPELQHYPNKYIYEPWKAPMNVQQQAKCIVGKDYPEPIVDHDVARKENLDIMGMAYKQKKYGDSCSSITKVVAPYHIDVPYQSNINIGGGGAATKKSKSPTMDLEYVISDASLKDHLLSTLSVSKNNKTRKITDFTTPIIKKEKKVASSSSSSRKRKKSFESRLKK